MNLKDLQALIQVIEAGSFTRAARQGSLGKSTLSRRVSRLEDELGLALLQRRQGGIEISADGQILYQASRGPLEALMALEIQLRSRGQTPVGPLRIQAPFDVAASTFFRQKVMGYAQAHPQVHVEIRVGDSVVDLMGSEVDVALVPRGDRVDQRCIARRCWQIDGGIYASPHWLSGKKKIHSLADIEGWDAAVHTGLKTPQRWTLEGPDGLSKTLAVRSVFQSNDFHLVTEAVIAGLGMGLLPHFIAKGPAARGEVLPILEDWQFKQGDLWLIWPESRHLSPRLRAFVDWMVG